MTLYARSAQLMSGGPGGDLVSAVVAQVANAAGSGQRGSLTYKYS